jgi:mono/diheme cytochrome c family protein
MPPFTHLSEKDVADIVAYLKTLKWFRRLYYEKDDFINIICWSIILWNR